MFRLEGPCYNLKGFTPFSPMPTEPFISGPNVEKRLLLLKPRGFCAGVVRAIDMVRIALDLYGPPVYVRKEIVHNKHVVEDLRRAGAVFVEELDEVPERRARHLQRPRSVPGSAASRRRSGSSSRSMPPVRW